MLTKPKILQALRAWVNQRPGLDFANYGDWKSYRSELRSITRDRKDALELMQAVSWRDSITADDLIQAFPRAFSGRLQINTCAHSDNSIVTCGNCGRKWCEDCDPAPSALCHWCHGRGYSTAPRNKTLLEYTTGQYWPTEYRKAAAAVLASVLWARASADMPAPSGKITKDYGAGFSHEFDAHDGLCAGDWLRRYFRREFGRGIQSRWFN